ncbi:MAG: tetratricopeptide repeat protein [Pseudomonadota bacterium]
MRNKWKAGLVVIAFALVAAYGCGGGATGGKGPEGVKGGPGGKGGVQPEISEAAKETFKEAVTSFNAHTQSKSWDEAACGKVAGLFEDASREQKDGLAMAIFNAGLVWHECKNYEKAKGMFKQALKMDPNYSPPRIMMANYAYNAGDVTQAEKMYRDAIKGAPLALESVEAYVNLAQIQRTRTSGDMAKNQDDALKNLRRALAIDAESLPAFTEMAYLYLDMAMKDKNKLTLAEVVCVQATKIDSNYAPIYNVWGLLKMRQGEIIEALKYFEKAYSLDGSMFEAYMNFGSITIGFRGYEDAKAVFSKAIELKPDNYEAQINLGVAQRGLDDFEAAEATYNKAIELDKTRPEAYFNMGVLYQDYRLDKAGDSGYDNFQTAIKWFKDFKVRAGTKKGVESFSEEAEKRLENCKKSIELIKEAAVLMKDAAKMQKEMEKEEAEAKAKEAAEAKAKAAEEAAKAVEGEGAAEEKKPEGEAEEGKAGEGEAEEGKGAKVEEEGGDDIEEGAYGEEEKPKKKGKKQGKKK